ncbi:Fis family transcriptional regulator [Pseudonocardia sulfidoxydans NBRC 16205]|uniref:Fis family transcriptional regulator n=1 Tax=Pseudonocardia sulfidoxydans NBRC 16205 TaxID=1223511 RepID=A0A511DM37_9PSEU|nr:Fis family transcriptional regulator [Pseudonocardia sulfidoxydans NBRC 16205]
MTCAGPTEGVPHDRRAGTLSAWGAFVGGDDEAAGAVVPRHILSSWRRCRDVYDLDPLRPLVPAVGPPCSPRHRGLYAHLGGITSAVVRAVGGCIATVSDGHGRVIAVWTDARLRRNADTSSLDPQFCWSEDAAGTNGTGMALLRRGVVAVRGPEHWRAEMHDWNCVGAALTDPVLGEPVASISISSRCEETVATVARRLDDELAEPRRHLARQAARDAASMGRACAREQLRGLGAVVGLDLGGGIVAGDIGPRRRPGAGTEPDPTLRAIARTGLAEVATNPEWRTTFAPGPPLAHADELFEMRLVEGPDGPAGWLLVETDHPGEPSAAGRPANRSERVAAEGDRYVLLLDPHEIRFAEAQGHSVWLVTDRGRLRAMIRGIDNMERRLAEHGFVRVHRSFLVNPDRVQRIDQKGNGVITLSTDQARPEDIPVSRRSTHAVRQLLGL